MTDSRIYDSRDPRCKTPYGAVSAGTRVTFTLRPPRTGGFSRARLLARFEFRDNEVQELPMPWSGLDGSRDRFTCTLDTGDYLGLVWYSFRLEGLGDRSLELGEYQLTVYDGTQAVPPWFGEGVTYQIFPDRFRRTGVPDPAGMVGGRWVHAGWDEEPEWRPDGRGEIRNRDFFGGSLAGVLEKLDYLKELGVDTLYFCPVFEGAENHRYGTGDYEKIDPMLGTEEDFCRLCHQAHTLGMRVILDGVFNHCGSFNKWLDRERIYENAKGYEKGAYVSQDSPYRSYFDFHDSNRWPYNPTYDGWWTHDTLPKLNYEESEELCRTILDVGRKWVSPPYNVDGWRLDVAADLGHSNDFNHHFWKEFRRTVKEANPDAVILAEHYGNPESWLRGDEWDTVMNYDAFMEPVTWFLTGMEKHSDEYREDLYGNSEAFIGAMKHHMQSLHMGALYGAMNELSNHDHSRFLTRTNHRVGRLSYAGAEAASAGINPAIMREAVVIQMTWPGSPTVYYGDEAGVCGFTDPDNRRTYPWGKEDQEMLDFHKRMICIHKAYPILAKGSLEFLWNDHQGLSYGRFSDSEQIIVILNNQDQERDIRVTAWKTGVSWKEATAFQRLMLSSGEGYTEMPEEYIADAGILQVKMPAYGAMVLHHRARDKYK